MKQKEDTPKDKAAITRIAMRPGFDGDYVSARKQWLQENQAWNCRDYGLLDTIAMPPHDKQTKGK